jgi:hypothetical protein
VLGVLAALVLSGCGTVNRSAAAAPAPAARTAPAARAVAGSATPSPTVRSSTTVTRTYHGDSLLVTLVQPATWTSQLRPLGIHYSDTFAFLANFPLTQFCHATPVSFTCLWARAGSYPPGGMLVILGTRGYNPLPADQRFGTGTPTTVDGHRARVSTSTGSGCLGVGADHSLDYSVDDGRPQGVFYITFCWRGAGKALERQALAVVDQLRIGADPRQEGPYPG